MAVGCPSVKKRRTLSAAGWFRPAIPVAARQSVGACCTARANDVADPSFQGGARGCEVGADRKLQKTTGAISHQAEIIPARCELRYEPRGRRPQLIARAAYIQRSGAVNYQHDVHVTAYGDRPRRYGRTFEAKNLGKKVGAWTEALRDTRR
jgi:hypothetical protein